MACSEVINKNKKNFNLKFEQNQSSLKGAPDWKTELADSTLL
jgi:hypothetical protein